MDKENNMSNVNHKNTVNHIYNIEHAENLLELKQIKAILQTLAVTDEVKEQVDHLEVLTDYYLIKRHQRETTEARLILDHSGSIPLHGLKGVKTQLDKLKRSEIMRPVEFELVASFIKESTRMKIFMNDLSYLETEVGTYAGAIEPLHELYDEIVRIIVRQQVDDNASSTLNKIRKKIEIVESRIKSKLSEYVVGEQYQGLLADAVISQRDGRYVIPVKSEHKKRLDGMVLDRSRSGGTFFIEPAAVKKLSDELAALRIDEENEVYRILSELTNHVASRHFELFRNYEIMVNYDFLFAKAKLSKKFEGVSARLNLEGKITIVQGRHPLLTSQAVPLDIRLSSTQRNLVITGPNTGGKTVAMKTVGLFCMMTQAGLHVPASKETELPIFERFLCDIGDGQSVSQNLSTFSAHITNIIRILELANEKSLVILDEIGAGTDPSEGMGIGIAVLEALNQKKAYTLTSTHYNEIKAFADEHPDFRNGSMAFDLKTLSPLYQLITDTSGQSNALHIALRIGMPKDLIERAHELAYKTEWSDMAILENVEINEVINRLDQKIEETKFQSEVVDQVELLTESQNDTSHKNQINGSKYRPSWQSEYALGDSVWVTTMNKPGIVSQTCNSKGEVEVIVLGKRIKVNHKRLKPYIEQKELYPEQYDLNIVLESKINRKKDKLISKGKGKGIIIGK